ncbi:MAG: UvrB/UvrC motif-containing protein, partial [Candidatus Omnitrophota bacterium]|nr:UvrB/UvrC motif-containing protein [Candidatus Omnitrophota bacterium]
KETKLKCPRCGLTYEDFKKVGRLGCGECYTAFKEVLLPLLKRIHGSTQHYGKAPQNFQKPKPSIPAPSKSKNGLQELKDKLQKAIQNEEFEEAAKLRDKIRDVEKRKK